MDEPFIKLLKAEIAKKRRELAKFEKALAMLEDEPKPIGRPPAKQTKPKRTKPARIGPARLEPIREAILKIAQERDEFRQIDVRTMLDITSSTTATAFEQLRQGDNPMIRFSRKDGNNKYFRLTPEALRTNGKQK